MEGLQRDTQAEWKCKQGIFGSSGHQQAQKMQVVKRMSYHSPGGQPSRQPQQIRHAPTTQYRAPSQQVQQPQGQQFPAHQGLMVKSTGYFKCGKEGHFAWECPENRPVQSAQPSANSRLLKRTVIKKKVPVSRSGQVNYMEADEIL
jgi:hypothetical protein